MDERLVALLLVGLGLMSTLGAMQLYRARVIERNRRGATADLSVFLSDGRPAILGFTGDYCAPCKTQQRPVLEQLRQQWGGALHVHELDALDHAELAQRYGVVTVPTTVVLNGAHQVVAINYGVASAEKLQRQLAPYVRA